MLGELNIIMQRGTPARLLNSPESIKQIEDSLASIPRCNLKGSAVTAADRFEVCELRSSQLYVDRLKDQRRELESIRDQYDLVCEQLVQFQDKRDKLEQQVEQLTKVKAEHDIVVVSNQKLIFDKKRLTGESRELQALIARAKSDNFKEKANELQEQLGELAVQISAERGQIKQLESKVREIQVQKKQQRRAYEQACADLQAKISMEDTQFQSLRRDFEENCQKSSALKRESALLASDISRAQALIARSKDQLSAEQKAEEQVRQMILAQEQAFEQNRSKLIREKSQVQASIQGLQSDQQKLNQQIDQYQSSQYRHEKQTQRLNNQLNGRRREQQSTLIQLKKCQVNIKALKEDSSKNEKTIEVLKEELKQKLKLRDCMLEQQAATQRARQESESLRGELARARNLQLSKISQLFKGLGR